MKSLRNILFIIGLLFINSFPAVAAGAGEWHLRSPLTFFGVTFGKANFVAVGEHGAILTSPDGRTWNSEKSVTNESLRAVVYGKDTFIAVGDKGVILTSPDAQNGP